MKYMVKYIQRFIDNKTQFSSRRSKGLTFILGDYGLKIDCCKGKL